MTFSEFERVLNHCPHLTNCWLFLRVGEFLLFVLLTSIKNMTIGTLFKIFPHAVIVFSPEKTQRNVYSDEKKECIAQSEYQHKLETLEKDRQLFELEKENWRLKREIEEIGKNEGVPDLLRR